MLLYYWTMCGLVCNVTNKQGHKHLQPSKQQTTQGDSMEINITEFFNNECPSDYSASRAEIGNNAGQDTWQAAQECDYNFMTDATRDNVREHFASFGAWSEDEIASWSDSELNALLIQDISSNMRDFLGGFGVMADCWDWDTYENDDTVSHRLFKGEDDEIYFYIGE